MKRSSRRPRKLAAGGVTLVGLLRERLAKHRVECVRELGAHLAHARGRLVQVCEHDRQLALAREWTLPRQALEEDAAERVDIGAAVDRPARDLLRRNVVDRADETAVTGQAAYRRDVTREPEVADPGLLDPVA